MRSDSRCPWRRNGRSPSRIVPSDRWLNKWRATRMGPQVEARGAETSWIGTQRGAWVSSCSRRISASRWGGLPAYSIGMRAHSNDYLSLHFLAAKRSSVENTELSDYGPPKSVKHALVRGLRLRGLFCTPQFLPHRDHALLHLADQPPVGFLGCFRLRRRVDGIAECHLQGREFLEAVSAGPRLIEAFDRDGNDRHLQVDGQDRRAFLEGTRGAVDAPFAFGVENQAAAVAQAVSSGAHGRDQVRIRIEDHDAHGAGDLPHDARAEDVAGTNREQVHEDVAGDDRRQNDRIQIALVVGRQNIGSFLRQLFQSGNLEIEAIARNDLPHPGHEVPEALHERMRPGEVENLGVGWVLTQHSLPAGKLRARRGLAAGRAFEQGVDQVADTVYLRQLSFFHVTAKLFFERQGALGSQVDLARAGAPLVRAYALLDLEAFQLAGGGAGQIFLPDFVIPDALGRSDLLGDALDVETDHFLGVNDLLFFEGVEVGYEHRVETFGTGVAWLGLEAHDTHFLDEGRLQVV